MSFCLILPCMFSAPILEFRSGGQIIQPIRPRGVRAHQRQAARERRRKR